LRQSTGLLAVFTTRKHPPKRPFGRALGRALADFIHSNYYFIHCPPKSFANRDNYLTFA
jgi:hypothetical protein